MKQLHPAPTRAEPSAVAGMPFLDAAGNSSLCKWPLGGAGADMVVCGGGAEPGAPYCLKHLKRSRGEK
jgi:hypothetical protein